MDGGVSPRVTTEKLGQLEAMVRAHPFAPTYGLANWSAAEAGWTVIAKAVPIRGAIGRRFIVVGPGGTPQRRSLPRAVNDILRKAGAPVQQPPPKRKRPNAAENAPLSPNGTLPLPHDTYLQQCSGAAGATSMTMNGDNSQKIPANSTSAVPMVDDDGAAAAAAMLAMAGLFTAAAASPTVKQVGRVADKDLRPGQEEEVHPLKAVMHPPPMESTSFQQPASIGIAPGVAPVGVVGAQEVLPANNNPTPPTSLSSQFFVPRI